MERKKLINMIFAIFMVLLQATGTVFCIYIFYKKNIKLFAINTSVVGILLTCYLVTKFFIKNNAHKLFSLAIFCYLLVFLPMAILKRYGVLSVLASAQKLKEIILKTGAKGVIVFIAISIAQVIISPVPGMATIVVGAQIFGAFWGFVYSSIGIIIGSIIAFSIGKLFGTKVINWFVGEEAQKKYSKKLEKKGRVLLPVAFLFPLFPDDILCIIAGTTTMSYKYFILITLITRPISILISSYLASGQIIPFKGYYLIAWAAIFIVIAAVFVVVYKKQEQIENWFTKKIKKKR